MKLGLLYWKQTNNIGDDIQCYAGLRFLPHVDYLIDREYINAFESDGHEPVAVVLNAWFLHNRFNWPPSNDIVPLCVAMHFTGGNDYKSSLAFLDGLGGDYMQHFAPIGCRDEESCRLLNEKGIHAYFSGCLTLTLPKQEVIVSADKYVCAVDVEPQIKRGIEKELNGTGISVETVTQWVDPSKYAELSFDERMNTVQALLKKYQNAHCVVTTRLHCALPCLAMGVPVLFVCDHQSDYRLKSFLKLLHVTTTKDFNDGNHAFSFVDPPMNDNTFLSMRQQLEKTVQDYVASALDDRLCGIQRFMASSLERAKFQTAYLQGWFGRVDNMDDGELKRYLQNCGLRRTFRIIIVGIASIPRLFRRAFRSRW